MEDIHHGSKMWNLRWVTYRNFKIPDSNRGNTICVCNQCSILQLVESPDYDATKDPHSLRFSEKDISRQLKELCGVT